MDWKVFQKKLLKNVILIRIYESTREAGRQTGFNYRLIGLVANGKQKTHKGYIWKYVSQ